MNALRKLLVSTGLAIAAVLPGCGTYVPGLQDFPGTVADENILVAAIVTSIHCEVVNAVQSLYYAAEHSTPKHPEITKALDKWGVQMALSLTAEEKSTINPFAAYTPISPVTRVFTLSGNALGSADATRIDKLNFYYLIPDLLKTRSCQPGLQPEGTPITTRSLLIQSDLKLKDWLFAAALVSPGNKEYGLPTSSSGVFKQNVLSHEVKFEVITSAGVTPAWKLVRANFDQTGTLAAATRDRIHDLIVTLGPGDDSGLQGPAKDSQLALEIGLNVAISLKGVILP